MEIPLNSWLFNLRVFQPARSADLTYIPEIHIRAAALRWVRARKGWERGEKGSDGRWVAVNFQSTPRRYHVRVVKPTVGRELSK